jgi:tRNA-Thr(GGU) m(6)t(6)A37 methyltransferase TsaA
MSKIPSSWTLHTIGTIHSCFPDKFGIPRQPGLAPHATATLTFCSPYDQADMVRNLADYSHLWIQFIFHAHVGKGWKPLVRPPRLGGNTKSGVWATRSPFRPNPIGLSVVKLEHIEFTPILRLYLRGIDLLDNTPVLDIKPYLGFVDHIPDAVSGFAEIPLRLQAVTFTPHAEQICQQHALPYPHLKQLIIEILQHSPQPAYIDDNARVYGFYLYHFNIRWKISHETIEVLAIETRI